MPGCFIYIHSLLSKDNNCIKKEEKVLAWLGFAIIIISEKNRLVSRNFGQTDFPTYSLSLYCCPGQNNGEKATIEFFAQNEQTESLRLSTFVN